jgi:uncharacterized protein (TIGR00730 family)
LADKDDTSEPKVKRKRRKKTSDKLLKRLALTQRLQSLRERTILLEHELQHYTGDHFRVCIFGSARLRPNDEIYCLTKELAQQLGMAGVDVLTGGGPGLMEAANIGVREGQKISKTKSKSFGITIELNKFEPGSEHLDIKHHHKRFSSRLDDFMRLSNAVIIVHGGIGTLLELFFSWQLLQVGHMPERPIILVDSKFWQGLIDWMKDKLIANGLVSEGDLKWIHAVDTIEEVMAIVNREHQAFKELRATNNKS